MALTTTATNMYLSAAFMWRKIKINSSSIATNYNNQDEVILIGQFSSLLSAKLNPEKEGMNRVVSLNFIDVNEGYMIYILNSIDAFKEKLPENPDEVLTMITDTFKKVILGEQTI